MEEPDEQELIRQAMRVIGSRKTPRKSEFSRGNIGRVNELRQTQGFPEETRAKLREAQSRHGGNGNGSRKAPCWRRLRRSARQADPVRRQTRQH